MQVKALFTDILQPLGGDRLQSMAQWLTTLIPLGMIAGPAVPEVFIGIVIGLFLLHSFRERDWQWLRKDWFIILFALRLVTRGKGRY